MCQIANDGEVHNDEEEVRAILPRYATTCK